MNLDEGVRNSDWMKTQTWDLPTDAETFLYVIGGRPMLDKFMLLPAAEAMPEFLRDELGLPHKAMSLEELRRDIETKYSEDQPRDDRGRFGEGGGASTETQELRTDPMALRTGIDGNVHAGTPSDPVPCGGNIDQAVRLIAEGHNVTLAQPEQVSTLLEKMASEVARITAAGEEKPFMDLCKVSVEGTNLFCADKVTRSDGSLISRVEMPQLVSENPEPGSQADGWERNQWGEVDGSEKFAEYLAGTGRDTEDKQMDPALLRASQGELIGEKVYGLSQKILEGKFDTQAGRIWVTRDNYVIDGHHRWAAIVAAGIERGEPFDIPVRVVDVDIGTALTMANYWTDEVGLGGSEAKSVRWYRRKAPENTLLGDAFRRSMQRRIGR